MLCIYTQMIITSQATMAQCLNGNRTWNVYYNTNAYSIQWSQAVHCYRTWKYAQRARTSERAPVAAHQKPVISPWYFICIHFSILHSVDFKHFGFVSGSVTLHANSFRCSTLSSLLAVFSLALCLIIHCYSYCYFKLLLLLILLLLLQ